MLNKHPFLQEEVYALEDYLLEQFPRKVGFLDEASRYVINAGGKRIRPMLIIIAACFGQYVREKILPVAAAIETLHTATLVHDDIIDNAPTRRGNPSLLARNGVNMAVYTGDYLLAKSLVLLAESGLPVDKLKEMGRAVEAICLGEVDQYLGRHRLANPREYLKRIMRKTGILLAASCALGAYAGGCTEEQVKLLGRFGLYFGTAYQIRDDLLDLESTDAGDPRVGKPIINDLKEGIATIPVILAARRDESFRNQVLGFLEGVGDIRSIVGGVIKVGGNEEARKLRDRYLAKCLRFLDKLPPQPAKEALEDLVDWLSH